jgi:putative transcriptional regulator
MAACVIVVTAIEQRFSEAEMRNWLIIKRKLRELTQLEVSVQAGISRAYYAQIELGQRNPSVRVARSIGSLLNFAWTCFFENYPECQAAAEPDQQDHL